MPQPSSPSSPSSPYADLDRPPLRAVELDRACSPPWTRIELHDEALSTNDLAADSARAGAASGLVVIAETQTAGRGRLGRTWVSPPRAGITLSVLLRPDVAPARRPWLIGLVAAATASALHERTDIDVRLKWPNDLVVDGRKLGGLLAESVDDAVVVGLGVNVSTRRAELVRADATSLVLEGTATSDRLPLVLSILRHVGVDYLDWIEDEQAHDRLAARYRSLCSTIGAQVRADLPDGSALHGEAVDVDANGHLVVDVGGEHRAIAAGDVVHLSVGD